MLAVAHCVEDTHKDIVHHSENGTAEIPAEIADGLGQDLRRGTHPSQNGGCQCNTGNRENYAGRNAERHIRMDGTAHGGIVPGAEITGNQHAGTHGQAVEESHECKNQALGSTDGCQRIFTEKIANNPGIEGVVKLLKQITQKNRQHEQQQFLPNHAFG